jgi:hypothetical protein
MIKVFYIYDRIEERADIKGQSELENRRTYKIMDKRNRAKRQTTMPFDVCTLFYSVVYVKYLYHEP